MKKIIAMVLALTLIFTLCGCMYTEDNLVVNKDGSGKSTTFIEVDKESYDTLCKDLGEDLNIFEGYTPKVVEKDGKKIYQVKEEVNFKSYDELVKGLKLADYEGVVVTKNSVRYYMSATMSEKEYNESKAQMAAMNSDIDSLVKCNVNITMPEKIVAASKKGKISADGYTASFNLCTKDFTETNEFMVSTAKESVAPDVNGATDGTRYNKSVTVKLNDASGIQEAAYSKDGGNEIAMAFTQKFTKNGTYSVRAKDYYGNEANSTFVIKDTKKPSVTGVANKKTYKGARKIKFTDNCGIVKATLNGKKIASGKKVNKKGSYKLVVTDVNGLKTSVAFKIK